MKAIVKALAGAIVLLSLWPGAQGTGNLVVDIKNVLSLWCTEQTSGAATVETTYGTLPTWDTSTALADWTNILSVNVGFANCAPTFNEDISLWNTGTATNMVSMFEGALLFNQDISQWNTEFVTSMYRMFAGAKMFAQSLTLWDVEKVTNMQEMFMEAEKYDSNALVWTVTEAINMQSMFYSANAFAPTSFVFLGAAKVTNMKKMFQNCYLFNPSTFDIDGLGAANLDMSFMFSFAYVFNSENIGSGSTPGLNTATVVNMGNMFEEAAAFNQPLDQWNTALVTNMNNMFKEATSFNQQLNDWNLQSITTMQAMFWGATAFNEFAPLSVWTVANSAAGVADTFKNMFYRPNGVDSHLTALYCTWNRRVMNVQNMICTAATCTVTCDPTTCDTWFTDACSTVVTDIKTAVVDWCIFKEYDPQFSNLGLISAWTIDGTTSKDWSELFSSNGEALLCMLTFNEDIGNWNTAEVTDMSQMFEAARAFNQLLTFNTEKVTTMKKMFHGAWLFDPVTFSFDAPLVTDFSYMFWDAGQFSPDTSFSIENVGQDATDINMKGMFQAATAFNSPEIGSMDTTEVVNMQDMFNGASNFNHPLTDWDTAKVTNMKAMFWDASAFSNFESLYQWTVDQTNGAETIKNMFNRHDGVVEPELSKLYSTWKSRGINVDKMICIDDTSTNEVDCDTHYAIHDPKSGLGTGAIVGIVLGVLFGPFLFYGAVKVWQACSGPAKSKSGALGTPFI